MRLIIDIPDKIYKASKLIDVKHDDVIQIPLEVISHGTVLPDRHGDLKDQDVFLRELDRYWDERKGLSYVDIQDVIRLKTPTIIQGNR